MMNPNVSWPSILEESLRAQSVQVPKASIKTDVKMEIFVYQEYAVNRVEESTDF